MREKDERAGEGRDGDPLRHGRDEMNLAEFPIGLIADRSTGGVKTVVYQDKDETLTVTGSDLLGLPTALDIDVMIALIHLTKVKNDFADATVRFTRYELMRILDWPDRGYYYDRLTESLNRWVGVTLVYKKAWWDNETRTKGNRSFHILESATVIDREQRQAMQARRIPVPVSSIRWSKEFFRSFQANNLKKLDLKLYYSLASAITKQLYRFLDKRFYNRPVCTFDLKTLACEHIGISRNYEPWRLKQKLQPAIDELVAVGFLKPSDPAARFTRTAHKQWNVRFERNERPASKRCPGDVPPPNDPIAETNELVRELVARGVAPAVAHRLRTEFPEETIRRQIEVVDWLMGQGNRRIRNPGAFLAKAIQENYATPHGFAPKPAPAAEGSREKTVRRIVGPEDVPPKKRRADESMRRLKAFWEASSPGEKERLDTEAILHAAPDILKQYEESRTKNGHLAEALFRIAIREPYLKARLGIASETGAGERDRATELAEKSTSGEK